MVLFYHNDVMENLRFTNDPLRAAEEVIIMKTQIFIGKLGGRNRGDWHGRSGQPLSGDIACLLLSVVEMMIAGG